MSGLKTRIIIFTAITAFVIITSCNNRPVSLGTKDSTTDNIRSTRRIISNDSVLTTDTAFIADSLLHINKNIIAFYIKKYAGDTCPAPVYSKAGLKEDSNVVTRVGSVRTQTKAASVFVLSPFNACEGGQSYYFTDTSLPRLQTDSWCCHPENLFLVGDIDEDGLQEIGWYYSTCVSHYKSLYVVSLKNNRWDTVGHSVFDQHYMLYDVPFSHWVRKTGKDKFEMLEITDMTNDKAKAGKKNWLKFTM